MRRNMVFEFGELHLDVEERLLLHAAHTVTMQPEVFGNLVVLVRHNGHLLEKEQLMKQVWPDTFVEEVNLAVNVSMLRKVLGELETGQTYIETVPKRGYRFVAPVRDLHRDDELVIHRHLEDRIVPEIPEDELQIGTPRSVAVSTAGKLAGSRRPRRPLVIPAAAVLFLVIVGGGFALYKLGARRAATAGFEKMKIANLTNSGKVVTAAISPEGKYVVYALADSGKQSLWIRQVATASNVQIVPPRDVIYTGVTFSGDGNYLYYNESRGAGELYQMPTLGGSPKKLLNDIDS